MKFVKGSLPAMIDALEQGRKILKKAEIEQSGLESELILSAAIRKPREFIYTHPEYALSRFEERDFTNFIKRRAKRMPLAYISGFKEFYDSAFFVNKNVLIPRPETEELVDLALEEIKKIQKSGIKNMDIIDVGAGSGAIIISILKSLKDSRFKIPRPRQGEAEGGQVSSFIAIDSSKRALAIAQENANRLGINEQIQFLNGNLLQLYLQRLNAKDSRYKIQDTRFKLILANLPYLTTFEMKSLQPEVRFEPRQALDGGKDGLDVYRVFFEQLAKLQNTPFTAICEIAPDQKNKLLKIAKASLPQSATKFFNDNSCRTRFAAIKSRPR